MKRRHALAVVAALALAIPAAYWASPPIEAEPVQGADVITGPTYLYLEETDNWQSLETGFEKLLAALPDFMDEPFRWAGHSDNLLSEIPVE